MGGPILEAGWEVRVEEFSQKAKKSFKMGLDFLQKKAQQQVDLAKLQAQLSKAEDLKQQALITLGERVCVMFDMDRFQAEELKDGVEQVRDLAHQIQQLNQQIQEVRHSDEAPARSEEPAESPGPDHESPES